MTIMECLLCKTKGEKTFNIHFLCGDARYTVKDDLKEFLGPEIEPHLKHETVVCIVCMYFLDDVAKVKRNMLDVVLKYRQSIKPIKLGKSWNFFAKIFRTVDDSDFDEPITPSLTPTSNPNRLSSTPSQFLSVSHTKEYNQELEDRYARREMVKRQRSQSKSSIRSGNDEEVATLFRGRKRKGRRPKSVGGLPKVITKKLRRVLSENDRSISSLSNLSCLSYTRPKKDFRPKTPKLTLGENNELIKRPRTRSISRMFQVSYCTICLENQKDLENYAAHMITVHKRKACFRCLDCGVNYMTEEHLTMHQKIHDDDIMCTICGEKHNNIGLLQKHTDRHLQYSVPCSYCDLLFLSEYECHIHILHHHRGRRRKPKVQKQYKIEQMATYVDLGSNNLSNAEPFDANYSTKKYNALEMIVNIERKPKFHNPSFDELDFRVRHPETYTVPQQKSSLGDDVYQDERFLNTHSSNSPSSIFSDSDAAGALSDSSASVMLNQRKRIRSHHRNSSENTSKDLSLPNSSPLDKLHSSNEDLKKNSSFSEGDRLSPPERSISELGNDSQTFGEESDNSSDGVQTEMHYYDGQTLHTSVDMADILNYNGSSGSNESNRQESVELEPDIKNDEI